jgi:superfamily II DNA helicase RecQ
MKYKLFTYPVPPPEEPEELNGFLASHRILCVQSHLVDRDRSPCLVFIVEYLDQGNKNNSSRQSRIDYREVLSEEDFQVFAKLRDLRKAVSEKEGVPVYAVFTNAQLAQMVESRVKSEQGLADIEGVGQSKIQKYGRPFIDVCLDAFGHAPVLQSSGAGQ